MESSPQLPEARPQRSGWNPILVITNSDQISEPERVEQEVELVVKNTPLTRSSVFVHSNYFDENERTNTKDLSYRRILFECFRQGLARAEVIAQSLGPAPKKVKEAVDVKKPTPLSPSPPSREEPEPLYSVSGEEVRTLPSPVKPPPTAVSSPTIVKSPPTPAPSPTPVPPLHTNNNEGLEQEVELEISCEGKILGVVLLSSDLLLDQARPEIENQLGISIQNFLEVRKGQELSVGTALEKRKKLIQIAVPSEGSQIICVKLKV